MYAAAGDSPSYVRAGWQTGKVSFPPHRAPFWPESRGGPDIPEQEPHAGRLPAEGWDRHRGARSTGQGRAQLRLPLHKQSLPPAETHARAPLSATPDSPRSQAAPVRPGGHRHWPVMGSQGAPASQSQRWRQPSPNEPGSHPGGGQWTQCPVLSPTRQDRAKGAHGNTEHSPLSQSWPEKPEGQTHWPLMGWQGAPCRHSHAAWQPAPWKPGGQAERHPS